MCLGGNKPNRLNHHRRRSPLVATRTSTASATAAHLLHPLAPLQDPGDVRSRQVESMTHVVPLCVDVVSLPLVTQSTPEVTSRWFYWSKCVKNKGMRQMRYEDSGRTGRVPGCCRDCSRLTAYLIRYDDRKTEIHKTLFTPLRISGL